jgi:galactokinase
MRPGEHLPSEPGSVPTHSIGSFCPGRVNLIGEHTDYNGGLAMPMAIDLGVTAVFTPYPRTSAGEGLVVITSREMPGEARIPLDMPAEADRLASLEPTWARIVAAVVAMTRPDRAGELHITSNLPAGAGLSSSAAVEVASALALGLEGQPREVALVCQRAEQIATGVPSGIMDQLCVAAGVDGAALLIDFSDLSMRAISLPADCEVVVAHSGETRALAASEYAARRAECEAASFHLGPLGSLSVREAGALLDPILRRRARHVAGECERVRAFAEALAHHDLAGAGRLLLESHRSLADDFEVSTPALDALVERLASSPGVYGARLTGAGFGGCALALSEPGAVDLGDFPFGAWSVRPAAGARLLAPPDAKAS